MKTALKLITSLCSCKIRPIHDERSRRSRDMPNSHSNYRITTKETSFVLAIFRFISTIILQQIFFRPPTPIRLTLSFVGP